LRRLFSTFARGLPGAGLLLMRLAAGAVLIVDRVVEFRMGASLEGSILDILAIGDGAFLVAGIWTPIAGSLAAALAVLNAFDQHGNACGSILMAAIGRHWRS
jgi:putative oxidoreductase